MFFFPVYLVLFLAFIAAQVILGMLIGLVFLYFVFALFFLSVWLVTVTASPRLGDQVRGLAPVSWLPWDLYQRFTGTRSDSENEDSDEDLEELHEGSSASTPLRGVG
uniref:Uncharacterized protein n=1 Tax=Zooxanthella nutricula TaxID=1333877 RepID=A0A7S2VM25_9DINO